MLSGQRATKLENEIRNVAGDGFEHADAGLGLQVDHRTHVKTADRSMGVHARRRAVPLDDREEPGNVVAKLLRRNRGVLYERERFRFGLHRHRQTERRLPKAPDASLSGQIELPVVAVPESLLTQVALDRVQPRWQVLVPIRVELDAQERARVSVDETAAQRLECGALARMVKDEPVHDLDC